MLYIKRCILVIDKQRFTEIVNPQRMFFNFIKLLSVDLNYLIKWLIKILSLFMKLHY